MKAITYIPSSDSDKGIWIENFSTKLGTHGPALGISAAEITSTQKDAAMYKHTLNVQELVKQTLQNITGYKSLLKHAVGQQHLGAFPTLPALPATPATVPEGVFDRVSKLVQRIKASAAYTDNIGADLGIIAPATTTNIDEMQPDIKIKLDAGRPHLKWTKGEADALDLFVDRNDGAGFVLLGRLMRNEYIDIASLAANKVIDEWHYKGIYVIADAQVGQYSAASSIMVKKI